MSSDSEDMEKSVVIEGSALAEGLAKSLEAESLTPHARFLMWIGVFVRLRVVCELQLGPVNCDLVLETVEAAHRLERAKALNS
jgi:hypothetical protein